VSPLESPTESSLAQPYGFGSVQSSHDPEVNSF
jgi:hypothetical protein